MKLNNVKFIKDKLSIYENAKVLMHVLTSGQIGGHVLCLLFCLVADAFLWVGTTDVPGEVGYKVPVDGRYVSKILHCLVYNIEKLGGSELCS